MTVVAWVRIPHSLPITRKTQMKLELLVLMPPETPSEFLVWDFDQHGFVVLLEL